MINLFCVIQLKPVDQPTDSLLIGRAISVNDDTGCLVYSHNTFIKREAVLMGIYKHIFFITLIGKVLLLCLSGCWYANDPVTGKGQVH